MNIRLTQNRLLRAYAPALKRQITRYRAWPPHGRETEEDQKQKTYIFKTGIESKTQAGR